MRKILKIVLLICLGILLIAITGAFAENSHSNRAGPVDQIVFPHDKVIDVYIEIDEETLQTMFDNAANEEYVMCNVVYNGQHIKNVGIRPKGNSSLISIVISDSNRYSFKLDFNEYVKNQSLLGITKINLNNNSGDSSMMREYLSYELSEYLGLATPRTTYVALYINNEYFGLYLAVENVDENFVRENFDNGYGNLYKPEEGTGDDLNYIDNDPTSYNGLGLQTNSETGNKDDIIEMMRIVAEGSDEEIEKVLDIDSFLKYYALCMATVNLDSIIGRMDHNYYLYNNNGKFTMIPWDFNLSFSGFGFIGSGSDTPVDEITKFDDRPIITRLLSIEENLERYHSYLKEIIDNYMNVDHFNKRVEEVRQMINEYVAKDPNLSTRTKINLQTTSDFAAEDSEKSEGYKAFIDATQAGGGFRNLLDFNSARVENIEKQLSGELPSMSEGAEAQISFLGDLVENERQETNFIKGDLQEDPFTVGMNKVEIKLGVGDPQGNMFIGRDNPNLLEMIPKELLSRLIKEYYEFKKCTETSDNTEEINTESQESPDTSNLPEGFDLSKFPPGIYPSKVKFISGSNDQVQPDMEADTADSETIQNKKANSEPTNPPEGFVSSNLPEGFDLSKLPPDVDQAKLSFSSSPEDLTQFDMKTGTTNSTSTDYDESLILEAANTFDSTATLSNAFVHEETSDSTDSVTIINGYEIDMEMRSWITNKLKGGIKMEGVPGKGFGDLAPKGVKPNLNISKDIEQESIDPQVTLISTASSMVLLLISLLLITFRRKI